MAISQKWTKMFRSLTNNTGRWPPPRTANTTASSWSYRSLSAASLPASALPPEVDPGTTPLDESFQRKIFWIFLKVRFSRKWFSNSRSDFFTSRPLFAPCIGSLILLVLVADRLDILGATEKTLSCITLKMGDSFASRVGKPITVILYC